MNSLQEVKTIKQVMDDLLKDFRVAQHSGELGLANRFLRSAKDLEAIASEEEDLRDVEGALREMESEFCEEAIAAQAGEPVAWWDGGPEWSPDSFTFVKTPFNTIPLVPYHTPQQQAPEANDVPEGYVVVPVEVIEFIMGEGDLNGFSYGERPAGKPPFWWRSVIRDMIAAATSETEGK